MGGCSHVEDEIIRDQRQGLPVLSCRIANRASPFALYAVLHAAYHIKVVCILCLIDRQPQTFAGAALNPHTPNNSINASKSSAVSAAKAAVDHVHFSDAHGGCDQDQGIILLTRASQVYK